MQKVILASGSMQRKNLFGVLNVPFEVIPADIDEKIIRHDDLKIQAESIARAKAEKVGSENEGIIIAADTFVESGGKVLEKPKDLEEAKEMLRLQSGNETKVYSGFCYLDQQNKIDYSGVALSILKFREMSEQEIEEYVTKCPVTTWSGGFSPAYPYGLTLIAEANGSLSGLTHGLPLELLIPLLKKSGFDVHP